MNKKRKNLRRLDIGFKNKNKKSANVFDEVFDCKKSKAVLYSRGKKTDAFFTEDSKLYITPREAELLRNGVRLNRSVRGWDNVSSRIVNDFVRYKPNQASLLMKLLEKRYALMRENTVQVSQNLLGQFSLVKLWNLSIVGSILFGMVTMTFVYRYLGQGAFAAAVENAKQVATQEQAVGSSQQGRVLAMSTTSTAEHDSEVSFSEQVAEIQRAKDQSELEKEIYGMVKGHPIEKMVPYIAKQDRTVAAFIVAIARKESGWGEHYPVLNGEDCYNYWGYRGQRDKMGTGGHTCFDSPQDAVDTVAKRIKTLAKDNGRDTPAKMVIWKCGGNCAATGGQAAADKWIRDVDSIYQEFRT